MGAGGERVGGAGGGAGKVVAGADSSVVEGRSCFH